MASMSAGTPQSSFLLLKVGLPPTVRAPAGFVGTAPHWGLTTSPVPPHAEDFHIRGEGPLGDHIFTDTVCAPTLPLKRRPGVSLSVAGGSAQIQPSTTITQESGGLVVLDFSGPPRVTVSGKSDMSAFGCFRDAFRRARDCSQEVRCCTLSSPSPQLSPFRWGRGFFCSARRGAAGGAAHPAQGPRCAKRAGDAASPPVSDGAGAGQGDAARG